MPDRGCAGVCGGVANVKASESSGSQSRCGDSPALRQGEKKKGGELLAAAISHLRFPSALCGFENGPPLTYSLNRLPLSSALSSLTPAQ